MKNRLKKSTAILLCVLLLISIFPVTSVSASNNQYYNVGYLEDYAQAAYKEEGLGAFYTPQATTWKVWSPTAAHVQVRLYATGSDDEEGAEYKGTYSMEENKTTGVWSLTLNGDYKNVYYTYLVTVRGVTRETRDVYAKAAGVNGDRSMVVDLEATNPDGWENDEHVLLDDSTDAVIWEVHVRDFSISPSSGVSEANRGKYLAFTEENTTVNGDGDFSTCLDYLKEMGVNTVHLMPVYDFGSVDETDPKSWIETTMEEALSEGYVDGQLNPNYYKPERNWGYDPNNYNVPEGSYSSDPYNGNTRIKEFKQMVQALHEAGISVVMDVVYNHTYDLDDLTWGRVLHNNAFNDTVPGYYFRLSSPLDWINGSGCGNVTASDKLMYRKYMVESVHYWAEEYHIDGFRFDLMACHDAATMNAIRADLDGMYDGEGEKILMYGEPWDGSYGAGTGIADGATVGNAKTYNINERIAMFCSWMRDAIKGDPDGDSKGWIQGNVAEAGAVLGGLSANDGQLTARSQTVTYADAHDNLILWDKIVKSNGSENYTDYSNAFYLKQLNLAKTIVLMSQGMAFNVAGTEFGRSKLGCHNSYKAGDNINAIDWKVRETNDVSVDYYKGLIQIRDKFSPITDPVREYAKYSLPGSSNNCIAVRIPNTAENAAAGEWANLILLLNNGSGNADVTLPEGEWTVVADGVEADPEGLRTAEGSYSVPGFGCAILVNGESVEQPVPEPDGDYYLIGYINGADYGCEADAMNKGEYKFVDGSLTATFTEDSYVYVKTGDNSRWYMTSGWLGTDVKTATLYNTDLLNDNGNKLFVPGGVEITFTLTEEDPNHLILSADYVYVPDDNFYLQGWINNADYSGKDYVFREGTLTTSFTADNYVMVKQGNTGYWTEGWLGFDARSAVLYPEDKCDQPNKLYVPGDVEITFTLEENGDGTLTLSYTVGDPVEPQQPTGDYYLFGFINGANYGCEGDWENLGDYHFNNGSLTATFESESYVAVKTGDNSHWYMTDGWLGTDVSSATLYDTDVYQLGENANKLYVPGNVAVTFTLQEGENDTLTLSYTVAGSKGLRNVDYYLFGYIDGADYGTGDDYENLGEYHFVNGSLTTSFNETSYVAVKTGDNAGWYMTDGWQGEKTSVTLYNTAELGEDANKLMVPGGVELTFTLSDNGNDTLTLSYTTGDPVAPPAGDAKNAVILHCWNWSYDTIRANLDDIKAAGYTMVQTSPAQPHSGWKSGTIGTGDWWMLYQPLGLCIAQENESWLGDEDDLKALCTAAHAAGIEVIVDVVSNHLCNAYNDIAAQGIDPKGADQEVTAVNDTSKHGYKFELAPDHRVYEYNENLSIDDFRTEYVYCNDENTLATVHGNIGMPDLKTETANVQTEVLNYLKELIDAGVDGFRFDAAKHIETPYDGTYASDFWPNVINGAEEYAESKGRTVWSYGEVLSTAGKTRKMNYYSEFIDMTEISYAYTITEGFGKDFSASKVANQQFKDWLGVGVETLANSDLVLMAESHDTYAQSVDSFSKYSPQVINKAWAVAVARADASALYFARPLGYEYGLNPDDPTLGYPVGTLGACESFDWKDAEVREANKFHTAFAGAAEKVYAAGNLVVVERFNASDCGAVIANATGYDTHVSFDAQHLTDGTYYDQITENEFTVSGGRVTGEMGSSGIVVLRKTSPAACEHPADQRETVTKQPTCTEDGCVIIRCKLCGRTIETVSTTPALGHIDANNDNRCDRCDTFLGVITVYFVDELDWIAPRDHFNSIYAHAYTDGGSNNGEWPGPAAEMVGRTKDEEGDGHGIWKIDLNPEAYQKLIFSGNTSGQETKTVSLSFAADAETAGKKVLIYKTTGSTVSGEYGTEYACETLPDLKSVCGHTAFTVLDNGNGEEYVKCDCCDTVLSGNPFVDVKQGKWFYDKVLWAFYHDPQITAGTDANHFSPNASCTRAQIVTFLYAAAGKPEVVAVENPFKDVKAGKWYYNAVMWAVQNEVTSGMTPDTFGINETCNRAQAVTFLYAMAGKPEIEAGENPFTDVKEGKWYYNAVMWAVQNGITTGKTPTTFEPNTKCTRAEIVTFLYAMLNQE